jgi:glycosyl hydrolase family 6
MAKASPLYRWNLDTSNKVETTAEDCQSYANSIRATFPARAAIWDFLASQPAPLVLAPDYGNAHRASGITAHVTSCVANNTVFYAWIYMVPNRNQTGGGASSEAAFKAEIDTYRTALSAFGPNVRAVFELEPDGVPKCYALSGGLGGAESLMRQRCFAYACEQLASIGPNVLVYINCGNGNFRPAAEIATLLGTSGIEWAAGIALNTAQNYSLDSNQAFFEAVKALEPRVGGWIYSSSLVGPYVRQTGDRSNAHFYNAPVLGTLDGSPGTGGTKPNRPTNGVTLGPRPTTKLDVTNYPGLHAILWSKFPGTSDDAHPAVGEVPEYPATTAPGPGGFYPAYWESAYNASLAVDFSAFAPFDARKVLRANHLLRMRS